MFTSSSAAADLLPLPSYSSSSTSSFHLRYLDTNRQPIPSGYSAATKAVPLSTPTSFASSSATSPIYAIPSNNVHNDNKSKQLQSQIDDLHRKIDEKTKILRQQLTDQQNSPNIGSVQLSTPHTSYSYTAAEADRSRISSTLPSASYRSASVDRFVLPSRLHDENHSLERAQSNPDSTATPYLASRTLAKENHVEHRHDRNALISLTNELNALRSRRKEKERNLYNELASVSQKLRENVAESKARSEIAKLREKRKETEYLFEKELQQLTLMWLMDKQRQKATQKAHSRYYYSESPTNFISDGYNSSPEGYYSSDTGGYYSGDEWRSGDENASLYEQRRKAFEAKEKQETPPKQTPPPETLEMKKKLKQALAELREKEAQIGSLKEEVSALTASQESLDKLKKTIEEQEHAFQAEREEWELEKENLRQNYRKQIEKETKRLQETAKQEKEVLLQKLATETLLRENAEQEIKSERLQKEGIQQLLQEARTVNERAQKDENNKSDDLQRGIEEETKKNDELQSEIENLREETKSLQHQLADARRDILLLSKDSSLLMDSSLDFDSSSFLMGTNHDYASLNGKSDLIEETMDEKRVKCENGVQESESKRNECNNLEFSEAKLVDLSKFESARSTNESPVDNNDASNYAPTEPLLYSPNKDDQLDVLISASLQKNLTNPDDLPHNFSRISRGVYMFGTKKLTILLRNGKPMVKAGGGSLMEFSEFTKKHGKAENAKIHSKRNASADKDCIICIKRKVTSKPSHNTVPLS